MTTDTGKRENGGEPATLANWLVLDLGMITAGAATSALLADAGAEVLKIESPAHPDPFRNWSNDKPEIQIPTSPVFDFTNRNKMGIGIDLKQPAGRDLFLRLARNADAVVENFRRGVMQNLGIAFEDLKRVNPGIVLASISSQGETGPDRGYTSYGSTLEATGGLASITGYPEGHPTITGRAVNYPDQIVSIFAMGAIVSAVLAARRSGEGVHLDISQREVTSFLIGETVAAASACAGRSLEAKRGNADPAGCPQFCERAADGVWVAVTLPDNGTDSAVAKLFGATQPIQKSAVATWVGDQSSDEAVVALRSAGAAAAPVLTGAQVLDANEHGPGHALAHTGDGKLVKGFPFQSRRRPFDIHGEAPLVGRDTMEGLQLHAGVDENELATLQQQGVIAL